MNKIIDGKKIAAKKESELINKVSAFIAKYHRRPKLVAVKMTNDPGSELYLKLKGIAAQRSGIQFTVIDFPSDNSHLTINNKFDGIFLQHPPGFNINQWKSLTDQIPLKKDVDCLTTENLQLIKEGKPRFLPATVKAVLYCLERSLLGVRQGDSLKYVILGRSPILGLPLFWYLKNFGADVTLLHSQSRVNDSRFAISEADVIISSIGKPGIITGGMVKDGIIAIDCGSPIGDIDFESVKQKAAAITPVPGGVGPLTVVSLMENVVQSAYHTDRGGS